MSAQRITPEIGPAANLASRRTSLLALSGAALAASTLPSPLAAARNNKNKAGTKAKKRCEKQGASCREFGDQLCALFHPPGPVRDACAQRAEACCSPLEQCDGGAYFACLFDHLEDLR